MNNNINNIMNTNMLTIEMIDKTQFKINLELINNSNVIKEQIKLFNDINFKNNDNNIYYYLEPNSQDINVLKDLFDFYKTDTDSTFFDNYDKNKLFKFIIAANYLDCPKALDISTTYVANIIKNCKSPQDIRDKLNIDDE